MAANWRELRDRIDQETKRIWLVEPDEFKQLRLGLLKNRAGCYGMNFATWDFANGKIRDFTYYTVSKIWQAALDPEFSLLEIKKMVRLLHPGYTKYLGYSGFSTLMKFDDEFRDLLDTFTSKEEFVEFYKSYYLYAGKLGAWAHHYFPWELGLLYQQHDAAWVAEAGRLIGGTEN